jgi:hypothetical protein
MQERKVWWTTSLSLEPASNQQVVLYGCMPATAALPKHSTAMDGTTNAAVSNCTAQGPDQTCPSTAIAVQDGLECLGPDGCLFARAR